MKLFRNGDCWLTGLRGQACGCASPYPTIMQSPALPHAQLQPGPSPSPRHPLRCSPCPLLPSALSPRCPDTRPSVAHPSGARAGCPVPVPRRPVHTSLAHGSPCHPPSGSLGSALTRKHADSLAGANMLAHMHTQSLAKAPVPWPSRLGGNQFIGMLGWGAGTKGALFKFM